MDDEEFRVWEKELRDNPNSFPYKIVENLDISEDHVEMMERQSFLWKDAPSKLLQVKVKLEKLRQRVAYLWHNGVFKSDKDLSEALEMVTPGKEKRATKDYKLWLQNQYRML